MFFANYFFLYFKADEDEASSIKQILLDYGEATGQRINYHKSAVSFSRNTTASVQEVVCSLLGVCHATTHGTYLGLLSLVERGQKKALEFVKDRVWHRLHSWNIYKLTRTGKEVLLKTVAQSLPIYTMLVFLLPLGVCQELEKMLNSFWWGSKSTGGRGINWCRWEPKTVGGLGFKKLYDFNLSLLSKQGWKFLTDHSALVTQIY